MTSTRRVRFHPFGAAVTTLTYPVAGVAYTPQAAAQQPDLIQLAVAAAQRANSATAATDDVHWAIIQWAGIDQAYGLTFGSMGDTGLIPGDVYNWILQVLARLLTNATIAPYVNGNPAVVGLTPTAFDTLANYSEPAPGVLDEAGQFVTNVGGEVSQAAAAAETAVTSPTAWIITAGIVGLAAFILLDQRR